jgi:CRP-like cAMP-binding protein
MGWIEILGYAASGAVFITFWMKSLISLRAIAIAGNILFFSYGVCADLANIIILHGALLPLNLLRLYQSVQLRRKLHRMAHATFDPKALVPFMTKTEKPEGTYLFKRGDDALDIFYLTDGTVVIEELDIELSAGQLIGEIAMFTPDKKRTQSVRCAENCTLMQISEEKALQIYAENPEFGIYVTKMMVSRLLANAEAREALHAA